MFGLLGLNAIVKDIVFTDLFLYGTSSGIVKYNYGTVEKIIIKNGVVKGTNCGNVCYNNYGNISQSANNAVVISKSTAGGICGASCGNINQCANYATISTTASDGGQTGGIVGYIWDGTVQDCFNTGFIDGVQIVGGITGRQSGPSTISSCYSIGNVKGSADVGGIIGVIYNGDNPVTSNCYYVNSCLCKGINGEDVENSATGLPLSDFYGTLLAGFNSSVWEVGTTVENAGYEAIGTKFKRKAVGKFLRLKEVPTFNDNVYETYYNFGFDFEYDGNEDWQQFIPLYSIPDLIAVGRNKSANYVLMNDISVSGNLNSDGTIKDSPTETWTSISGYFMGKFSGDNHVISGLYGKGIFDKLGDGIIMNVRTENCYFYSTTDYLGSIVNNLSGGIIINCRNTSKVEGDMYTGGIGGHLYQSSYFIAGRIENCWNSGDVTGSVYPGGIIGDITGGTIRSCCNTGNVTSTNVNGGGICGGTSSTSAITAVCNFGTINSLHGYIGGLTMSCKALSQSYNAGSVIAESEAGAIMKSGSETDATDCYYDSDKNTWKGIADADFIGSSTPMTTSEFCSGILPTGFSSDYWEVREPQIIDNQKVYFYPYLKGIGEESAQIGFKRNVYSLKLHANGGSYGEDITFYVENEGVSLPSEVVRTGYEFKGWYSNSNFTSEVMTSISGDEKGDMDMYAKWAACVYQVSLQTNEGSIHSGNVTSYTYGYGAMLPTDVTKLGYTFGGWYDNEDCLGDRIYSIPSTEINNKVFYAKWDVNTYNVTFVTSEGIINSEEIDTYTFGIGATLPTDVTKTGYTFGGWYTNDSYSGSTIAAISTTATGDKTFYAKWNVNSYDVTLNTNGGTINNGNVTSYNYGVGAILPIDVTKTGCTFGGWYESENFTTPLVSILTLTDLGNKEFYAKWDTVNYTITYNANSVPTRFELLYQPAKV